jgi:hypothetical protein
MQCASGAIERGAPTFGKKTQNGSASEGVASYDFAGTQSGSARDAQYIVRRERDDFVMAASPALIAPI